jgi:hypothetical protein
VTEFLIPGAEREGDMTHGKVGSGTAVLTDDKRTERLLEIYKEVCASYHAIDDFRTKLLGALPVASLVGILAVGKDSAIVEGTLQPLIGFGSFFGAAFTLGLFLFEVRGILRCDHLITRGRELEEALDVDGQFHVCSRERDKPGPEKLFNSIVAACALYSLVFAAWLFMALRFSLGWPHLGCGLTAVVFGGLLAVGVHKVVRKRIPA